MRLRILTLDPADGDTEFTALVKQDDEHLRNARAGQGPSERAAIQDAVNNYFAAQADGLLVDDDPPVDSQPRWTPPADTSTATYQTKGAIRTLLEMAAGDQIDSTRVEIAYEDGDGNRTTRVIIPTEIEEKRAGAGFLEVYVTAFDIGKDDARTFRLDRIKSARSV